ncbi:MAG: hypothetical protein OEM97_02095 [Acidimicrobiia bacterium]|nr:hypothetical protein [Acidimicrobiia bacterium]
MSRYLINKVMLMADSTDDAIAQFKQDAGGFVDMVEASSHERLSPGERAAFEAWDFGALYALGAHPYILWQFIRGVYVPDRMSAPELSGEFIRVASQHGYPDFAT